MQQETGWCRYGTEQVFVLWDYAGWSEAELKETEADPEEFSVGYATQKTGLSCITLAANDS